MSLPALYGSCCSATRSGSLFNFRLALAKAARAQGAEVVMVSPPGPYGAKVFAGVSVPMVRRSLNPMREVFVWALWRLYRREKSDMPPQENPVGELRLG